MPQPQEIFYELMNVPWLIGFTSHLALPVNIKINTGSSAGLQISLSTGIDCQNGGTPINSNTCLCPGALFGKHCELCLWKQFEEFAEGTCVDMNRTVNYK